MDEDDFTEIDKILKEFGYDGDDVPDVPEDFDPEA